MLVVILFMLINELLHKGVVHFYSYFSFPLKIHLLKLNSNNHSHFKPPLNLLSMRAQPRVLNQCRDSIHCLNAAEYLQIITMNYDLEQCFGVLAFLEYTALSAVCL